MEQDSDENVNIEQEPSLVTEQELRTLKDIEQKLITLAQGTYIL